MYYAIKQQPRLALHRLEADVRGADGPPQVYQTMQLDARVSLTNWP